MDIVETANTENTVSEEAVIMSSTEENTAASDYEQSYEAVSETEAEGRANKAV